MKYLFFILAFTSTQLHAHGIRLFATYDGNQLSGRAYSGSKGIANVTVTLLNKDGSLHSKVATDADGKFSKTMSKRVPLKLTIKLADGHRANFDLDIDEPHTHDHDGHHDDANEQRDHQHDHADSPKTDVAQLKLELAKLQGQRRLRDVIGGIGFVFGLAGVVMMIKSRGKRT